MNKPLEPLEPLEPWSVGLYVCVVGRVASLVGDSLNSPGLKPYE